MNENETMLSDLMNEEALIRNQTKSIRYLVNILYRKACAIGDSWPRNRRTKCVAFKMFTRDEDSFIFATSVRDIYVTEEDRPKVTALRDKAKYWIVRHEVAVKRKLAVRQKIAIGQKECPVSH